MRSLLWGNDCKQTQESYCLSNICSVKALFDEDITASTDKDMGMITTAIGFSLSFFLALYKYEIGHKLQSETITAGILRE